MTPTLYLLIGAFLGVIFQSLWLLAEARISDAAHDETSNFPRRANERALRAANEGFRR